MKVTLLLLLCFSAAAIFAGEEPLPAARSAGEVLLVMNGKSEVSEAIGHDYMQRRQVRHFLTVHCIDSAEKTDNETIPYDDYVKEIEEPVRTYLSRHPGIDFIVLTKGVPLRVRGGPTGNAAGGGVAQPSVDSSLAALDYAALPGVMRYHFDFDEARGYAYANRYWNAHEPFSHAKFGGYLVTRLDGYTAADAMALTSRSLEAEKNGTPGNILLDIQPEFGMGDKTIQPAPLPGDVITAESKWSSYNAEMAHAADLLEARGLPVETNTTSRFAGHLSNLAGYYSWGSNDSHFKAGEYETLYFAAGSISDTAVSTCARTFLPTTGGQSLTADLIAHGLTAAKGYCNEPLLQANSSPSITLALYTSGYTMAESFYAGSRFVGWEDIVLGDPLCAPYRKR
jgi:uncharacterized protein (TIGR03790 family)